MLTCKCLGLLGGHGAQVLQITLVSNEHNDDIRVCVITQLLEPPGDVHVGGVLGDIVHEECADCSAVVSKGRVG